MEQNKLTYKQDLAQVESQLDLEDTMSYANQSMEIAEAFDSIRYHTEDYQAGFEQGFWLGRELLLKQETEQSERTTKAYEALSERWGYNKL